MGRKKIEIKPIQSAASRRATFEKRRIGLLKKAMELSILCDCTISVTIERKIEKDLQIYASEPFDEIIAKYQQFEGTYRLLTNDHIDEMIPGKMTSNSVGYQVRKRAESIIGAQASAQHYAYQRSQINPSAMISNMEIVPTLPSPNLNHLCSQLQRDALPSPHPTFNGYHPNSKYVQSQFFQFPQNEIPPPPPTFNHAALGKRSFAEINQMVLANEPETKRFKIENTKKQDNDSNTNTNTNTTSNSNTVDSVDIPSFDMSFSVELPNPNVNPLELQLI